jgi:hypothetical protein
MQNEVCTESNSSIHLYRVLEDEYISLYGALPSEYPWLFVQSHIKDRPGLINKLREGATELSKNLRGRLEAYFAERIQNTQKEIEEIQKRSDAGGGNEELEALFDYLQEELERLKELQTLPDYEPFHPRARALRDALVDIFNQMVSQDTFYTKELFAGTELQEDTERLVAQYLNRKNRPTITRTLTCRINRMLLEDAFADEIQGRDLANLDLTHRSYLTAIYSAIHKQQRSALCLSGGGIRSATFNLGILQGLARHNLLDKFDYLSTVSGGGYIGSWLSSWIHREPDGIQTVMKKLSQKPPSALQPETQPVQHLRSYSNYLSPKLGLLSADTWTLVAIVTRNLLLNWLVFIPLLIAIVMIPRLYVSALTESNRIGVPVMLGISFVAQAIGIAYIASTLPSSGKRSNTPKQFLVFGLTPLTIAVVLLTLAWAWVWVTRSGLSGYATADQFVSARTAINLSQSSIIIPSILLGLFGCLVYFGARLYRGYNPGRQSWWQLLLVFLGAASLTILASALVGFLVWKIALLEYLNPVLHPHAYACFAVPLLLILYAIGGTLIAGLTSRWTEEDDQEWWARCGAWLLIVVFGWATVSILVIFGPQLPVMLRWPEKWSDWQSLATALATAVGVISGVITLFGGFSSGTPSHRKQESSSASEQTPEKRKPSLLNRITPLAAPAFLAFIIILLSLGTNWILISFASTMDWLPSLANSASQSFTHWFFEVRSIEILRLSLADIPGGLKLRSGVSSWLAHLDVIRNTPFRLVVTVWIILIVFGWIMARAINTNMFSIHSLYGNRLKRAYLGASRSRRRPHMFTGFDATDNVQMHELRPELFDRNSFDDSRSLVYKLKQPNTDDLFSIDLRKKLSPNTVKLLDDLVEPNDPSTELENDLINDLNRLLHSGSLFDKQRYPLEKLRPQTQGLLDRPPLGESLVLLNRLLLEDVYSSEIKPRQRPRLLHVVNIALNLVRGEKLAWQERKAETFTVSPLHSGNFWLGYRRSRYYGGDDGISLGTAFTISGAAASPNMGYMISSPLVSFLMAMFNVRLGWWLGNPGKAGDDSFTLRVPRFAFGPIVQEALSLTNDRARYVYLSDGGHFENLGLYEMVLRRSKIIVLSDASTDPDYTYDALGMAIRKIRIDLGIPIEMDNFQISPNNKDNCYFTKGRIRYSCVDDDGTDGVLIYIKASLSQREPRDVLNYADDSSQFPQEVIVDQFFSESQFESYRMLGSHIVDEICTGADGDEDWMANGLDEFLDRLQSSTNQEA